MSRFVSRYAAGPLRSAGTIRSQAACPPRPTIPPVPSRWSCLIRRAAGVDAMARVVAQKLSEALHPASHRRQPGRRRRHHRHARGRAGGARRLHPAARTHRHDLDQSEPLHSRRLRPAQGFRADRAGRLDAGGAAGASVVPGKIVAEFIAHGKEGPGQVQSRHLGGRHRRLHVRRIVQGRSRRRRHASFPTRAPRR